MRVRPGVALLLATLALAGCTTGDPEESTDPALVSPEVTPTQDEPLPPEPTPTADPFVGPPAEPLPPAEPTPAAAPAPAAAPGPAPAPAPAPAPEPAPAPAAEPSPVAPPPPPPPPPPPAATPAPSPTPDPQPEPEPEPETWPREGSSVSYRVTTAESYPGTDGGGKDSSFTATWTYRDGDWRGVCEGESTETLFGETTETTFRREFDGSSSPHWPPFDPRSPGDVGDEITVWVLKYECGILSRDARYAGMSDGDHTATDFDTGEPDDFFTRWDPETGLVESWSWSQRYTNSGGSLTSRT